MPGLRISLKCGFDELPADSNDKCSVCKQLIIGVKYGFYMQVGDPVEVKYISELCKYCYNDEPDPEEDLTDYFAVKKKVIEELKQAKCPIHSKPLIMRGADDEYSLIVEFSGCCEDFNNAARDHYYRRIKLSKD